MDAFLGGFTVPNNKPNECGGRHTRGGQVPRFRVVAAFLDLLPHTLRAWRRSTMRQQLLPSLTAGGDPRAP